jgi:hypothetical protein
MIGSGGEESWKEIDEALRSDNPVESLRAIVSRLIEAGVDRGVVIQRMEEWRKRLQDQRRDVEEDVVLEVMDLVVGWSGPGTKL